MIKAIIIAALKLRNTKPLINQATISKVKPLIIKENNPKVMSVMGKEIICKSGLIVIFNNTKTKPAIMAVIKLSIKKRLGKTRASAINKRVLIIV